MYYLTTTIDELGMIDVINDAVVKVNAPMRKRQPFGIVRTEEPINAEEMPDVMVSTFYLVFTGDAAVKNDKQASELVAAMFAAAEEIERMNNANYVVSHPRRMSRK